MIHFASDPRDVAHLESIQLHEAQPALFNQLVDPAIQIAAATNDVLKRIEPILPPRDRLVVAPAMLEEEKSSIWLEDSADISQSFRGIWNRTESPRAYDRIEPKVVKRE